MCALWLCQLSIFKFSQAIQHSAKPWCSQGTGTTRNNKNTQLTFLERIIRRKVENYTRRKGFLLAYSPSNTTELNAACTPNSKEELPSYCVVTIQRIVKDAAALPRSTISRRTRLEVAKNASDAIHSSLNTSQPWNSSM